MRVIAAWVGAYAASFTQAGSDGGQFRETIYRLMCGPANSTQNKHTVERIIKGPREMPRNTNEDSALALFPDPHLRLRLAVFDGRSEHSCPPEVSGEFPIALVHKLCGVESGGEFVRAELKFLRSVAKTRTRPPGASEPVRQGRHIAIRVHGPVQEHQPATALEECVKVLRLGGGPGGVVVVERDHVRALPVFRARPTIGGFDAHAIGQRQQFRPALAPERIIVKAGRGVPRVLGRGTEDDPQTLNSRREEA